VLFPRPFMKLEIDMITKQITFCIFCGKDTDNIQITCLGPCIAHEGCVADLNDLIGEENCIDGELELK
jgi:hypothetical protein